MLVLSLFLAGCTSGEGAATSTSPTPTLAPEPTVDAATGSIAGKVIDDEARPIAGATVAIGKDSQSTTDEGGKFTFNDLQPGSYVVNVARLGFEQVGRKVEVRAGEVAELTLTLKSISLLDEPRTLTIPKVSYIVFGNAYTQFATQQVNASGSHEATCQGCLPVIHFDAKPKGILTESLWTCGCTPPAINQDVWIKYLKDWTTGATLDGTVLINTYLSNREQFLWGDGAVSAAKTAKDNRILFMIHAGNYINHENRVSTWHSFVYNADEFPDNFTAMPPA
ncbi:MAG: carboxypeptidase regulatory-like domain-containing protein [Euryarchaeota archaeon]|nr:carboxypeptidase regulatory-like domain-containing protein [Euryarchaeota archaeon]